MTEPISLSRLELAGFITEEGVIGRRVRPIELLVPADISLVGNRLVWAYSDTNEPDDGGDKHVKASAEAVDGFLKLAEGTPADIFRYAKRWGPMGFCKHGLPATHSCSWGPDRMRACRLSGGPDRFWEPIAFWQLTSRRAHALLKIGARLSGDKPGAEEDWRTLDFEFINARNRDQWSMLNQKITLESELTRWMQMGLLVPVVAFRNKHLSFALDVLHGPGLFGFLALQIALAISSTDGLSICSACGAVYFPTRRPNINRRTYCPECRKRKRHLRDASRAYRQRYQQATSKGVLRRDRKH
jgi:hypothetical protein